MIPEMVRSIMVFVLRKYDPPVACVTLVNDLGRPAHPSLTHIVFYINAVTRFPVCCPPSAFNQCLLVPAVLSALACRRTVVYTGGLSFFCPLINIKRGGELNRKCPFFFDRKRVRQQWRPALSGDQGVTPDITRTTTSIFF